MPELPEVETTRRGIEPHLVGQTVTKVVVRQRQLRYPVPRNLSARLRGAKIEKVTRRAKYLLVSVPTGGVLLHLGMSGSLRVVAATAPPAKHDHFDLLLDNGQCLRLRDPRRFGAVLWAGGDPERHRLLATLGPEPLEPAFSGEHLYSCSRGRRVPVKQFIMDNRVVVGVGNIYASEALFYAGIHPLRAAEKVSRHRYEHLSSAIRSVLEQAIAAGGTTLRDFVQGDGQPGYFRQALVVYGRSGEPCIHCSRSLLHRVIGQRATYYCGHCQR